MQFRTKIESYDEWELTFAEHELFRHLYAADVRSSTMLTSLQGKIAAIKYLRSRDNLGLKVAKDRVDSMWDSLKNA